MRAGAPAAGASRLLTDGHPRHVLTGAGASARCAGPYWEGLRVPWSTLEVRWFLSGPPAAIGSALEAWFRGPPPYGGGDPPMPMAWQPAPPAWRQDRYLLVPGEDDIGIKWREGRLEIKGREAALGHRAFAPKIEGVCERWVKWSYAGAAIEHRFRRLFCGWRRTRCGDPREAAPPAPSPPRTRAESRSGSMIRASAVWISNSRRSGSPGHQNHTRAALVARLRSLPRATAARQFVQIVARVLDGCPALPLSAERSMSYPHWLLAFDQEARGSD